MGGPPGKSKLPLILGIVGGVVVIVAAGLLLYFFVFSDDDEASTDDYCTLLEENQDAFSGLTSGTVEPDALEEAVATVHEIREAAPDEVADEWAVVDDPLQDFQQVLDDNDMTWQDLAERQPGDEIPDEVQEGAQRLNDAFLSAEADLSAIGQTISDHAQEECGIDLEQPSGGQ
ncbi:MAG: hypothetical protein ACRDPQ_01155 [Nocardioidaceae bacterium]